LDALGDDVLHIPDPYLLPPVVIGGRCPAHYYLGVVCHQFQHGGKHVLSYVFVVKIDFLAVHHLADIALEWSGHELFLLVVIFLVVDGVFAADGFCDLAFLVTTSDAVYVHVA
jgi:hypothetical protein